MTSKPLILIPVSKPPKTYTDALSKVGLDYAADFSPRNLNIFSGMLLTGGGDILSTFYKSKTICTDVNVIRDVNEIRLFEYFFNKNLPVLGVCRGLQLINVCLGGTLKNVEKHQSPLGEDVFHGLLPTIGFFKNLQYANSNHKQCVDRICKNAQNSIFSYDGTVEGFSVGNTLAVQFHPERMGDFAVNLIFGEFAKRASRYFERLR